MARHATRERENLQQERGWALLVQKINEKAVIFRGILGEPVWGRARVRHFESHAKLIVAKRSIVNGKLSAAERR